MINKYERSFFLERWSKGDFAVSKIKRGKVESMILLDRYIVRDNGVRYDCAPYKVLSCNHRYISQEDYEMFVRIVNGAIRAAISILTEAERKPIKLIEKDTCIVHGNHSGRLKICKVSNTESLNKTDIRELDLTKVKNTDNDYFEISGSGITIGHDCYYTCKYCGKTNKISKGFGYVINEKTYSDILLLRDELLLRLSMFMSRTDAWESFPDVVELEDEYLGAIIEEDEDWLDD